MNFIGEKCVYCNEVFKDGDDVVVCPECGSPHHRECYKKENRCANLGMHKSGRKWQREKAEPKPEAEGELVKICPACHLPNSLDNKECSRCGLSLDDAETFRKVSMQKIMDGEEIKTEYSTGFNPDEDMGGATLKEVSMFVGPNTFYYIPIFKKMKDIGSKISFNLSCCIFPSFYFANRRMWLWAIISALISVIFEIPTSVMIMAEQGVFTDNLLNVVYENQSLIEELQVMCGWGSWIFRILLCLFANRIYFNFVLKNLRRIRLHSGGKVLNPNIITALGGVKPLNIVIITLITLSFSLVAMVGIVMLLNIIAVV